MVVKRNLQRAMTINLLNYDYTVARSVAISIKNIKQFTDFSLFSK